LNLSTKTIFGNLPDVLARLQGRDLEAKCAVYEPPLRSELFSSDQMEQHGKTLAGLHTLLPGHAPDRLLMRLAENEAILTGTRSLLVEAVKTDRSIAPAAEWLLDNFYLIEEQIHTADDTCRRVIAGSCPACWMDRLPGCRACMTSPWRRSRTATDGWTRKVSAVSCGLPDSRRPEAGRIVGNPHHAATGIDRESPARRGPDRCDRMDRNLAIYWADRITEIAAKDPKSLILVIADMARSNPPLNSAFVAEFARRLQGQGPALAMPLTWIEQHLSECNLTIDQLVRSESQQQAADQVSISNSIGSLRFLGAMDWREFVERMSVVEQTLREDPRGTYSKMDFATRDRYRHVVEKIAKSGRIPEREVAIKAIRLARESAAHEDESQDGFDRAAHVGYYLSTRDWRSLNTWQGSGYLSPSSFERRVVVFPCSSIWARSC